MRRVPVTIKATFRTAPFDKPSSLMVHRWKIFVSLLTPLLICALFSANSSAQEWTRFRGPNGQGQSDAATIPITWTDQDYNWKVELPGVGHSSPVVWGDRVFVTSADLNTATRHVLCLSTADGKTLWQRDFPGAKYHVHNQNNFAVSTPALDADRVYLAWASADEFV
jgi:outer membrane protein assembly factor BamB